MNAEQYNSPEEERDAWFGYAERDLLSVQFLFDLPGVEEVVASELQQAVEKFLKGYLIYRGWELVKTHDIELLLIAAVKHDRRFEAYYRVGRLLSGFYVTHRYPPIPGREVMRGELEMLMEKAMEIKGLVKGKELQ